MHVDKEVKELKIAFWKYVLENSKQPAENLFLMWGPVQWPMVC